MIGLGSQSQLGIGIAISLSNQFSAGAAKVNQDLINMRRNANSALTSAVRDYRNQSLQIAAGAAAISYGFYSAAQQGAKFQHSINQTYIVGGKQLGRSRKELSDFAIQMSKTFSRDPQEIAQILFENVKAGVGAGLEEITKYQLAVATATDEAASGVEGVGEKLLGITYAMGMRATDTIEVAGKKMTQFARVSNATTAAANATMASVYSIGESMEYFSNTAELAGLTLEQTLALVGKLAQSKIQGSAAGTALHNMTQQLINSVGTFATPKKQKAWGVLGINPDQVKSLIDQGKIYETIEMINEKSKGLGRTDRLNVFNALFNMRGQRGMVNAFLGGEKSLADIRKEIEQGVTGDVAMKQSKAMMSDLYSDMKFISNAFAAFKVSFAKSIEPGLRAAIKIGTVILNAASKFVETPVGKVLTGIVAAAAPMIALLFGFRAAVFTATLALNTMGRMSAIGGSGALMGGMMGNIGGLFGGGLGKKFAINKAGRAYVAAGQTMNFGGKLYKGGQILPAAFSAGGMRTGMGIGNALGNFFGMGSMAAAGSSSTIMGGLAKAGPWIARMGGFALRWLPVVGWIWTAVELLRAIAGNTSNEDEPKKSDAARYYENLNGYLISQQMVKGIPGYEQFIGKFQNASAAQPSAGSYNYPMTVNVNLDGEALLSRKILPKLDDKNLRNMDFNLNY